MSKKNYRMKVGLRSTEDYTALDLLRWGSSRNPKSQMASLTGNLPVDVFMKEMSRKWGRNG